MEGSRGRRGGCLSSSPLCHSLLSSLKHAPLLYMHSRNVQPHDKPARRGRTSCTYKKQTHTHALLHIGLSLHAVFTALFSFLLCITPSLLPLPHCVYSDRAACQVFYFFLWVFSGTHWLRLNFKRANCRAWSESLLSSEHCGFKCRTRPVAHIISFLSLSFFSCQSVTTVE